MSRRSELLCLASLQSQDFPKGGGGWGGGGWGVTLCQNRGQNVKM